MAPGGTRWPCPTTNDTTVQAITVLASTAPSTRLVSRDLRQAMSLHSPMTESFIPAQLESITVRVGINACGKFLQLTPVLTSPELRTIHQNSVEP